MNNTMRNLTLSAAALAALTVIAPTASADEHGRGRGRGESPRQEFRERGRYDAREHAFRGYGRYESRERGYGGRAYVTPRYAYGYGYRAPYVAPFRVFSGFRFYSAVPGPGYVYVAGYGWVLPPFFGAVWVPGHYDIDGFWVEGFWR